MTKRKFLLSFSPGIANEPITFRLVKNYELLLNILRAEVGERGGRLVIEIEGQPSMIKKGVKYLEESGVEVKELNEYVSKDEERCTHCGACVSICPAEAFQVREDHRVEFKTERCIACGLCIDACPPQAMKLKIW